MPGLQTFDFSMRCRFWGLRVWNPLYTAKTETILGYLFPFLALSDGELQGLLLNRKLSDFTITADNISMFYLANLYLSFLLQRNFKT